MKALCHCRGLSSFLPTYLLSKGRELSSAKTLETSATSLPLRVTSSQRGSWAQGVTEVGPGGLSEGTDVLHHFWVIPGWLSILGLWFQHSKSNTLLSSKRNLHQSLPMLDNNVVSSWGEEGKERQYIPILCFFNQPILKTQEAVEKIRGCLWHNCYTHSTLPPVAIFQCREPKANHWTNVNLPE